MEYIALNLVLWTIYFIVNQLEMGIFGENMTVNFTREELDALSKHIVAVWGDPQFDECASALAKVNEAIEQADELNDFDCGM